MTVQGGVAASVWVAVVYALGRGLSVHELAADGAAFFVILPAARYALDGIAARWHRRPPAAHRRAHPRSTHSAHR